MLTIIRLFFITALIFSTLLSTSLASSSNLHIEPFDYQQVEFIATYQQYIKLSQQERGNAKKMYQRLSKFQQQDPNDPFIAVLIGSSQTLIGRDAKLPWSKLNNTKRGLHQLEQAQLLLGLQHDQLLFEQLPISIHVQAIAAITFSQVPDFFSRLEQGYIMLNNIINSVVFQQLKPDQQTFVYYYAINAAYKMQNIQQAQQWQLLLKNLNIDDDFSKAAAQLGV